MAEACNCNEWGYQWDPLLEEYVCAHCGEIVTFDDGIDDDTIDEYEEQLSNCGMTRSGFCMLAGTEYCDWDCQIDWSGVFEDLEEAADAPD